MFSGARSHSDQTAEEETKDRPPYVEAPDAKEPFERKYKGACYCGEVEIAANSDPVVSTYAAAFSCFACFTTHLQLQSEMDNPSSILCNYCPAPVEGSLTHHLPCCHRM